MAYLVPLEIPANDNQKLPEHEVSTFLSQGMAETLERDELESIAENFFGSTRTYEPFPQS